MSELFKRLNILMMIGLLLIVFKPIAANAENIVEIEDGILRSGKGYTITSSGGNPNHIMDNDLDTEIKLTGAPGRENININFDDPKNISHYLFYVKPEDGYNYRHEYRITFHFDDGKEKIIFDDSINYPNSSEIINLVDVVQIVIRNANSNSPGYFKEIEFYEFGEIVHDPISALSATATHNKADLTWINPESVFFESVEVYKNDVYEKTIKSPSEKTTITGLEPETEYTFKAFAKYVDGGKSVERVVTITTLPEPEIEIKDLQTTATHERVNLSWTLPENDEFKHVNIYRDVVSGSFFKSFFNFNQIMPVAYASSTKIFETNGTYFNDLSVEHSKEYEYKLTTETLDGAESDGVTKIVKTAKKPKPDEPNSEMEKDENGDYLITWTSPTEGKVLIKIDGKDYKTVDASTGSYLIPEKDMKYSFLGNPLVQIIAIDSDGDESSSSKPGPPGSTENGGSGGGIGGIGEINGIKAKDVLSGTMSFIKLLGPFIILGLIIYLVPRLIIVIKESMNKNRNYNR